MIQKLTNLVLIVSLLGVVGLSKNLSATTTDKEMPSKFIEVRLSVPDTTWNIKINEIYQVGEELWVISQLSQLSEGMMGLMMISDVHDRIKMDSPSLPIKHYILGKTWGWENSEANTHFINSLDDIKAQLDSGKKLYPDRD